jgi:hypothetical protein
MNGRIQEGCKTVREMVLNVMNRAEVETFNFKLKNAFAKPVLVKMGIGGKLRSWGVKEFKIRSNALWSLFIKEG